MAPGYTLKHLALISVSQVRMLELRGSTVTQSYVVADSTRTESTLKDVLLGGMILTSGDSIPVFVGGMVGTGNRETFCSRSC